MRIKIGRLEVTLYRQYKMTVQYSPSPYEVWEMVYFARASSREEAQKQFRGALRCHEIELLDPRTGVKEKVPTYYIRSLWGRM